MDVSIENIVNVGKKMRNQIQYGDRKRKDGIQRGYRRRKYKIQSGEKVKGNRYYKVIRGNSLQKIDATT